MAIYTVTFSTMDQDVGANPFWHTFLFLSRFDEKTNKHEVVENWGFYGNPPSSKNKVARTLKASLGLETDFYGNHGTLKHEKLHYLDAGCGLHGVTFELSEEQFNELSRRCNDFETGQKAAISEALEDPQLKGKVKPKQKGEKDRNYPEENYAKQIYDIELKKAREEKREPRLAEFALLGSFTRSAHTCKGQVLDLLDGIITPKQINRLRGGHHAVSRFSGTTETIHLHSCGELAKFKGELRSRNAASSKLYWTLPPQEIETNSAKTYNLFMMHPEYVSEAKKLISQLQRLYWFFINVEVDAKYKPYCEKLAQHLQECYEKFSVVQPKKLGRPDPSILENLETARNLISNLHFYAVMGDRASDWEVRAEEEEEKLEQTAESKECDDDFCLEELPQYLSSDAQRRLAIIVGDKVTQLEKVVVDKVSQLGKAVVAVPGQICSLAGKVSSLPAALFAKSKKETRELKGLEEPKDQEVLKDPIPPVLEMSSLRL